MVTMLLGAGVLAWLIVLANFGRAYWRRRSTVRFIFCVMSLGWPLWLLRELRWLPRNITWPLALLGVSAGLACAYLLIIRWLNDPHVLD